MSEKTKNHLEEINLLKKQLQEIEVKYQNAINEIDKIKHLTSNISDIIWILDPIKKEFTYVSNSVKRVMGYTPQECINKHISIFFTADTLKLMEGLLRIRLSKFTDSEEKTNYTDNLTLIHKDGSEVCTEVISFLNNNSMGNVEVIGTARDIGKRRKAELELKKSELMLKEAQKIAQLGHWELDIVNNKLSWSDEIYRIFELIPQEFDATYEGFLDTIHPEDREAVNEAYTKSIKNKKSYEIEHRLLLKKEKIKYILEKCNTYYNRNGEPLRSIGTIQDITKQKKAEQEIIKTERQYRGLVETSQNLIWICDLQGRFTYLNPAWESTHGYKIEEMLGKPFTNFQRSEDSERDMKEFSKLIDGGSVKGFQSCHIKKNGEEVFLIFNAIPLKNNTGEIIGTQGTAYDITEQRKLQHKVLNAVIQTEEAERRRIGQELHDGIGPVLSTVKLFIQTYLTSKDDKFKQKIAPQMVSGINDALDQLSYVSQNLSPHILIDFGLEAALKKFIDTHTKLSKIKIKISYQLKKRLNEKLEFTIYRISMELINNTIKHANATDVELSIIQDKKKVYLDFFDNGKGFDFHKIKEGKKGMGLFNIYNRIKSMNGNLDFIKKNGVGVFYKIEIPLY
jgi:PAS domain S-box-containing protein